MKKKSTKVEPHPTHFRDAKEKTNPLNVKFHSSEEEVHRLRKQVEEQKNQIEGLKNSKYLSDEDIENYSKYLVGFDCYDPSSLAKGMKWMRDHIYSQTTQNES